MVSNVVFLPLASSSEHLEALTEVSHFGVTDMGFSGQGSWTYRILEDPSLAEELEQKANARSCSLVDLVSFQPCPSHVSLSQDRSITEEWDLPDGPWVFNGVLDGNEID
jgi:pyruvate dehydrogenase phosphatase